MSFHPGAWYSFNNPEASKFGEVQTFLKFNIPNPTFGFSCVFAVNIKTQIAQHLDLQLHNI